MSWHGAGFVVPRTSRFSKVRRLCVRTSLSFLCQDAVLAKAELAKGVELSLTVMAQTGFPVVKSPKPTGAVLFPLFPLETSHCTPLFCLRFAPVLTQTSAVLPSISFSTCLSSSACISIISTLFPILFTSSAWPCALLASVSVSAVISLALP